MLHSPPPKHESYLMAIVFLGLLSAWFRFAVLVLSGSHQV